MSFYDRFSELCEQHRVSPSAVAKAIGLTTANPTYWKRGSTPKGDTLRKLANYFGVSVGYLLDYEQEKVIIPGLLKIIEVNDPDLKSVQYRIEATDEEAYKYGLQIFENAGASVVVTNTPMEGITVSGDPEGVAAIKGLYEKAIQARLGQKTYGGLTYEELCALYELGSRNRLEAAYAKLNLIGHDKVAGFAEKLAKDPKYLVDPPYPYRHPPQDATNPTPPAREENTTPTSDASETPPKGE